MYALFGGDCYYAAGGFNDFLGAFSTEEEAVRIGEQYLVEGYVGAFDEDDWEYDRPNAPEWYQVVDLQELNVIAKSRAKPLGGY